MPAYNANFVAAMEAIFGGFETRGTLPVMIPTMSTKDDGTVTFGNKAMHERGFGIILRPKS